MVTITSSKYLHDYVIEFLFSDGRHVEANFRPIVSEPNSPITNEYLDIERFKNFQIMHGVEISWDDYAMCFDFDTLYKGGDIEFSPKEELLQYVEEEISPYFDLS